MQIASDTCSQRRSLQPSRCLLTPRRTAIGTPDTDTAILFFSRRPEREGLNKQFVQGDYAKNRRVAEAFYEHARRAVAESTLPVVEINAAQQRGPNFGARLAHAFADVFAAGYDRVIAVGNDCPSLHEVDWTAVEKQLEDDRPVLGPTSDQEGAYLIGLTREQFERDAFAALPWNRPVLLAALHRHLAVASGVPPARLAARDDVNGPAELLGFLRRHPDSVLCHRLRRVLGGIARASLPTSRSAPRPVLKRRSRAPPAVPTSGRR